jgi:hypothetical protein
VLAIKIVALECKATPLVNRGRQVCPDHGQEIRMIFVGEAAHQKSLPAFDVFGWAFNRLGSTSRQILNTQAV